MLAIVQTRDEPCPKCHSVMYLEKDRYGEYWTCICGKTIELLEPLPYVQARAGEHMVAKMDW